MSNKAFESNPKLKTTRKEPKHKLVDHRGNVRFHGAFTGGYSAGYFNTVGSAEGWTPAQFSSSRTKRAEQQASRPEDFMDDEDFAEAYNVGSTLTTRDEFASIPKAARTSTVAPASSTSSAPAPIVDKIGSLMAIQHDRVGVRMLRKMGWRPGQGAGLVDSHTTKRKRPTQTSAPGLQDDDDDDDDYQASFPEPTPMARIAPKSNTAGLGYQGIVTPSQTLPQYMSTATTSTSTLSGNQFEYGQPNARRTAFSGFDDDMGGDSKREFYDYDSSVAEPEVMQLSALARINARNYAAQQPKTMIEFRAATDSNFEMQSFPSIPIPPRYPLVYNFTQKLALTSEMQSVAQAYVRTHNRKILDSSQRQRALGDERSNRNSSSSNIAVMSLDSKKRVPDLMSSFTAAATLRTDGRLVSEGGESVSSSSSSSSSSSERGKSKHPVRTEEKWIPNKLLCRRFNVEPPHMEETEPVRTAVKTGYGAHIDSLVAGAIDLTHQPLHLMDEIMENVPIKPDAQLYRTIFENKEDSVDEAQRQRRRQLSEQNTSKTSSLPLSRRKEGRKSRFDVPPSAVPFQAVSSKSALSASSGPGLTPSNMLPSTPKYSQDNDVIVKSVRKAKKNIIDLSTNDGHSKHDPVNVSQDVPSSGKPVQEEGGVSLSHLTALRDAYSSDKPSKKKKKTKVKKKKKKTKKKKKKTKKKKGKRKYSNSSTSSSYTDSTDL